MAKRRRRKPTKEQIEKARQKAIAELGLKGSYAVLSKVYGDEINALAKEYLVPEAAKKDFTGKAGVSAAGESLARSLMKGGGKLTEKDYTTAAFKGGMAEGKKFYYGTEFGQSRFGGAGGAGLFSGLTSVGSQLINKGEVDYRDVGKAGLSSGAGKLASSYTGGGFAGAGAASVGAALVKSVYDFGTMDTSTKRGKRNFQRSMTSNMWSAVPYVGGFVGDFVWKQGKGRDRFSNLAHLRDKNKGSIFFDPRTGKMRANQVVGVNKVMYGGDSGNKPVQMSRAEMINEAQVMQKQLNEIADEWNEAIANYDNEDIATQLQIDAMREGKLTSDDMLHRSVWSEDAPNQKTSLYGTPAEGLAGAMKGEKGYMSQWALSPAKQDWHTKARGRLRYPGQHTVNFEGGGSLTGIDMKTTAGQDSDWGGRLHSMESNEASDFEERDSYRDFTYDKYYNMIDEKKKSGKSLSASQEKFYNEWQGGTHLMGNENLATSVRNKSLSKNAPGLFAVIGDPVNKQFEERKEQYLQDKSQNPYQRQKLSLMPEGSPFQLPQEEDTRTLAEKNRDNAKGFESYSLALSEGEGI